MCWWSCAGRGRPSCMLACCRHCSSTILKRLGWTWCNKKKNQQANTETIHPMRLWKSRPKLTGVYFASFTTFVLPVDVTEGDVCGLLLLLLFQQTRVCVWAGEMEKTAMSKWCAILHIFSMSDQQTVTVWAANAGALADVTQVTESPDPFLPLNCCLEAPLGTNMSGALRYLARVFFLSLPKSKI